MSFYSETILFAVVLAVNLLIVGAITAGGTALAFRFVENISPRLRYSIIVVVFMSAILLPLYFTLKTPSAKKSSSNAIVEINKNRGVQSFSRQSQVLTSQDASHNLTAASENSSEKFLNDFIALVVDSSFGSIFLIFWVAGSLWFFSREVAGLWQIRQMRKIWMPAADSERKMLDCPKGVPLYFDEQQSPCTVGLLRPVIVLPKRFLDELPLDTIRAIVRHELAHAEWRDPLVSLSLRFLRALFWISPALWLLERVLHTEREAAADRSAIASMSGESKSGASPLDYAEALLVTAKRLNSFEPRDRKSPVVGISTKSELETRIRRILCASQTTRGRVAAAALVLGLSFMALAFMPAAVFSDESRSRQKENAASAGAPESYSILKVSEDSQPLATRPSGSMPEGEEKAAGNSEIAFHPAVSKAKGNKEFPATVNSQPAKAPRSSGERKSEEPDNPDSAEEIDKPDGFSEPLVGENVVATVSKQEPPPARAPQKPVPKATINQASERSAPGELNQISGPASRLGPAAANKPGQLAPASSPPPASASRQ